MEETVILAGTGNTELAAAVARELGMPLGESSLERFPDGEIEVQVAPPLRGRTVLIVQPTAPPVTDHLVELIALCDACRRAAAARVVAIVPYFGYARSDRRKGRQVAVMGRVVAGMLESTGIHQLVTVDLHSPQVEGFFRIPVENLSAIPALIEAVRASLPPDAVVVSPDLGAVDRATTFSERLGLPLAILSKRRVSGREVKIRQLIGEVRDRHCVIVDDMISTGGTIAHGIETLLDAGARPDFTVVATHGLFTDGALPKLAAAGVREVVVTDSVAQRESAGLPVRRVPVAPLLVSALGRPARAAG